MKTTSNIYAREINFIFNNSQYLTYKPVRAHTINHSLSYKVIDTINSLFQLPSLILSKLLEHTRTATPTSTENEIIKSIHARNFNTNRFSKNMEKYHMDLLSEMIGDKLETALNLDTSVLNQHWYANAQEGSNEFLLNVYTTKLILNNPAILLRYKINPDYFNVILEYIISSEV